jgi:DNA invertase Pin-like site-specific DNA recombinase
MLAVSEKENAVIYARYSSHNQNEQSIEGQLRICYEYAKRNGYTVIGEYIDRALTGKTDSRPDFQRMIDDSAKHQFQFVIVYKLDRFARNRYDSAVYKRKLKLNGVRVLSAEESIGDNPESIILEAVLEASAEYYSVDLSQKITRGMTDSAMKGGGVGGRVPVGYKSENKKLVLNPDTAPLVKWAFEQYAAGMPMKEISMS